MAWTPLQEEREGVQSWLVLLQRFEQAGMIRIAVRVRVRFSVRVQLEVRVVESRVKLVLLQWLEHWPHSPSVAYTRAPRS